MPYTPPAPQSSGISTSITPVASRDQSCQAIRPHEYAAQNAHPRPALTQPTSAYLHLHRRSPSSSMPSSSTEGSQRSGTGAGPTSRPARHEIDRSALRESICCRSPIGPTGIISPPESSHTPSDDETTDGRGRARDMINVVELQEAMKTIPQHRASSPERMTENTKQAPRTIDLSRARVEMAHQNFDTKTESSLQSPLSAEARKISHSRSNTDSSILTDFPRNTLDSPSRSQSESDAEDVEDDELRIKPPMLRKKSGELVRPALRPSYAKRRPSSMPGTPTYSKAVHFDPSLEHVRHFLQVDRPIAVSAGSSPIDPALDDDGEFPFAYNARSISPPFEWEIRRINFPAELVKETSAPVKVERVYLSSDNKHLMGAVRVKNLAFHKFVVARFTLDFWKTTSEVVADYCNDFRRKNPNDGYDRFVFSIKLEDQANLDNKTLFFCIRYSVNGQEFWDNNHSFNYQVVFSKKLVPQNGKNGMQGNFSRPLHASRSRSSTRPRSMPISSEDFAMYFPAYELPSHSPLRYGNPDAGYETGPDTSGRGTDVFSQAFDRYDFGTSLAEAKASGDRARSSRDAKRVQTSTTSVVPQLPVGSSTGDANQGIDSENAVTLIAPKPVPEALTSEKPALGSGEYHDFLKAYCFFASGKSISYPAKAGARPSGVVSGQRTEPEKHSSPSSSSGSSTLQANSPELEEMRSASKSVSPVVSRTSSPTLGSTLGSRAGSPASFGYPYRQPMQNGFFAETHTPTAIRG